MDFQREESLTFFFYRFMRSFGSQFIMYHFPVSEKLGENQKMFDMSK